MVKSRVHNRGVPWPAMVRFGVKSRGCTYMGYSLEWYGMVTPYCYDLVWFSFICYGVVWYGKIKGTYTGVA